MHIDLTCRTCGKRFRIPFGEKNSVDIEKCPNCNCEIPGRDNAWLYDFSEKVYENSKHISSMTINGIYADIYSDEQAPRGQMVSDIFHDDIANLIDAYTHADSETQHRLAACMDKLFLLVFHDVKSNKLSALDETLSQLHDIFMKRIESRKTDAAKLLGDE